MGKVPLNALIPLIKINKWNEGLTWSSAMYGVHLTLARMIDESKD